MADSYLQRSSSYDMIEQAERLPPISTELVSLHHDAPSNNQKPEQKSYDSEKSEEKAIISVKNVHKTYLLGLEGVPALRGVSLSIKKGEFIVILGKSGGGKTSLLNILGTIDKPTKGELHICDRRITSTTTDKDFAFLRLHKIGFVFQQFNLIATMTAQENVALPMTLAGRLSRDQIKARSAELLRSVGMGPRLGHLPSQLSGGEQQRVTIARAMANSPSILLLDEPTGDLDSKNSNIVLKLLTTLNRKDGITCIMVTHDQNLRGYASRIVHMMDGKILRIEQVSKEVRHAQEQELIRQLNEDIHSVSVGPVELEKETRTPDHYKFLRA